MPYAKPKVEMLIKDVTMAGFDQVPVSSMQGPDLGGQGANYGSPMDNMPSLGHTSADLNFDSLDPNLGAPPGSGGSSMWFDTDL